MVFKFLFTQQFFFGLLLLNFWTSCGRFVEEPSPWNKTPMPVVYSILTPNDTVKIYLGQTYSTLSAHNKAPYPEAKVYISCNDSAWHELTRLKMDSTIFVDTAHVIAVEKGKRYDLRIEMNGATLTSTTTVPIDIAKILSASFHAISSFAYLTTVAYHGFLNVNYTLPANKNTACVISSIWSNNLVLLEGSRYQTTDYSVPVDSAMIAIEIETLNMEIYKLRVANYLGELQIYDNINAFVQIASSFGGTQPRYSNINGGVGIFSSYAVDRKRITVDKK